MIDQRLDTPETVEVEADGETLAAIDRALEEARLGRSIPIADVRKRIPQWRSKYDSPTPR